MDKYEPGLDPNPASGPHSQLWDCQALLTKPSAQLPVPLWLSSFRNNSIPTTYGFAFILKARGLKSYFVRRKALLKLDYINMTWEKLAHWNFCSPSPHRLCSASEMCSSGKIHMTPPRGKMMFLWCQGCRPRWENLGYFGNSSHLLQWRNKSNCSLSARKHYCLRSDLLGLETWNFYFWTNNVY
jgi:hypothetical protein